MSSRTRVIAAIALLCVTAACSETDRIVATSTPPVTSTTAVVPTTAAPTATTARPSSTTPPPTSAAPTSVPPSATSAAPSPSGAPPGASLPPMPAQPAIPTGATILASGTTTFTIAAGRTLMLEPADLASSRGASPPPSATLLWTLAWRATDPLVAAWYRQTSRTELGRGRWGTADLGGAGFELRNDGSTSVFGELSYTIASR